MDPTVWGPKLWFALHTMTFNYPINPTYQDKRHYHDLFENLKHTIPCDICKQHYKEHLQVNPISPHLDSRDSLVKWLVDVHNSVNKSLGKPILNMDQVVEIYRKEYSKTDLEPTKPSHNIKNKSNYFNNYMFTSFIVVTILLSIFLYIRCVRKNKIKIY
jgi:hypothetical protein